VHLIQSHEISGLEQITVAPTFPARQAPGRKPRSERDNRPDAADRLSIHFTSEIVTYWANVTSVADLKERFARQAIVVETIRECTRSYPQFSSQILKHRIWEGNVVSVLKCDTETTDLVAAIPATIDSETVERAIEFCKDQLLGQFDRVGVTLFSKLPCIALSDAVLVQCDNGNDARAALIIKDMNISEDVLQFQVRLVALVLETTRVSVIQVTGDNIRLRVEHVDDSERHRLLQMLIERVDLQWLPAVLHSLRSRSIQNGTRKPPRKTINYCILISNI
jgi:hypothetical protein